ncbi:MAG: thioredoxin fold domain-containing protein [Gammaproteobacteria bacterium]
MLLCPTEESNARWKNHLPRADRSFVHGTYSTSAWAAAAVTHTQPLLTLSLAQANSAIASASHGQAHALKLFRGPDGLVGAVIEGPSKTLGIAWLTRHGKAVLSGDMLIGPGGTDLTKEAMFSQGLLLRPAAALEQAAALATHGIMVGTAGPRITVFFDPNCIYCHQLYLALTPQVAASKVRVRYVIVGVLKESSLPRAASILAAKNPSQALNLDEADFDVKTEEGGYPVAAALSPAFKRAVEANNSLFSRAGLDGTPTILYCVKATKDVQVFTGIPKDIMTFVASAGDGAAKVCE